ncbi:MAG: hypothetical protein RJB01_1687 [Actinomycetota bacterium]
MARRKPKHPPSSREPVGFEPRASGALGPGDLVQLTDPRGNKYTTTLVPGEHLHTHRGLIAHDSLVGQPDGSTVTSSKDVTFAVLRPGLDDYVLGMPRGAAVVYPKDAARIVALADLGPGSSVIEAGVGSGALTCYLLRAVGRDGNVTSVELRAEFAEIATENVCRWFGGWPHSWEMCDGDFSVIANQLPQASRDAVVLDMLAPWDCLEAAAGILRPGGTLVGYVATTTQMSRLVEALRVESRWTEPRAEESLLRTWHLDGLSVRPDHSMNGHTGFLVTARLFAPAHQAPRRHRRPAPGAYGEDYQPK